MKILLKDFQITRTAEFVKQLRRASKNAAPDDLWAVSLSSPTGSGKTVIATAAIERLLKGDDLAPPVPDAVFLWITDQPQLNEQTRRKMLATASDLTTAGLVTLEAASFDQETFTPGKVYFLNTQKLAKNAPFVNEGDRRTYTLWQTITNTIQRHPGRFFVFIDEAHRGMTEAKARKEATTIIQKFVKGSPGEIPSVPLIVGITATPDRFNQLLEGQTRITAPVVVTPQEVRESGLLKESVFLFHPKEDQPSDMTMLRAAARAWKEFTTRWQGFCAAERERPIRPVLVVQVENEDKTHKLSKTPLKELIQCVEEEIGPVPPSAFAHAFQEDGPLELEGRKVRRLDPSDIDADPEVQVVLFKTSLTTGWDCPRAEVMMSFRTAEDATLIAQLIGRMVRTPLARRIEADEFLNTVSLYLPHYNKKELERVVERLTKADPDTMPPITVEKGEDALVLNRAPGTDDYFEKLAGLTSYTNPKARKTSEVRRLMKLSRLLSNDGLNADAPDTAEALLVGVLQAEYERIKGTAKFQEVMTARGKVNLEGLEWAVLGSLSDAVSVTQVDLSPENIDELFEATGRKLTEGLHKKWQKVRVAAEPEAKRQAKRELLALCAEPRLFRDLEKKAQAQVQTWLMQYKMKINKLPESDRLHYDEIRQLASDPEPGNITYPQAVEGKKAETVWARHLYLDEGGKFPAKFTSSWEIKVIETELQDSKIVGWLRNPDRKPWSLSIPFDEGGVCKPFYPDFLFLRETEDGVAVDLLDPHLITAADAPGKAVGLAKYAAKHHHDFGRIQLIIVEGEEIRRLDLTDEKTRQNVLGVSTTTHLKQLFDSA